MKIVTVDKRFKIANRGFKIALRFDSYTNTAAYIERWCREHIGQQEWTENDGREWHGYFGRSQKKNEPRPYYIAFKNESYASTILLIKDEL